MFHVNKRAKLFDAIVQLDRKLVKKLIFDEGVDLTDMPEESLNMFLKVAVESRDAPLVRKFLEVLPDLSSVYAARLLWVVVEDGDTEIASMLVRAGADVNNDDLCDFTFLHLLSGSKDPRKLELAVLMMEHGADVTVEDFYGNTALGCAIRHENVNFARELLKEHALILQVDVEEAVLSPNYVEWIKILIDDYVQSESTKKDRVKEVFCCLCHMDLDDHENISYCLETLLDVEIPDVIYLYTAVTSEKPFLVNTLLNSARIDKTTKMMLLHAAVTLEDTAMTQLLLEWGAKIDFQLPVEFDTYAAKASPLHIASASNSNANVKLLLRLGAKMNVINDYDETPFSESMVGRNKNKLNTTRELLIKRLAFLVAKGLEINSKDLSLINHNPNLLEFFEECLKELDFMRRVKVLNNFVFYTIFDTDITNLSLLMRRSRFAKNCNRNLLKFLFPLYFEELDWRVTEAENRRNILIPTEISLNETLGSILPDLVIDEIIFHLYKSDIHLKV